MVAGTAEWWGAGWVEWLAVVMAGVKVGRLVVETAVVWVGWWDLLKVDPWVH